MMKLLVILFILKSYLGFNIVERRVKLNNKMPFHRKISISLLRILDELTIRSDLVRFAHILCF